MKRVFSLALSFRMLSTGFFFNMTLVCRESKSRYKIYELSSFSSSNYGLFFATFNGRTQEARPLHTELSINGAKHGSGSLIKRCMLNRIS